MAAPAARRPGIFARIEEGQQWVANLYANVFLMEHWGRTVWYAWVLARPAGEASNSAVPHDSLKFGLRLKPRLVLKAVIAR